MILRSNIAYVVLGSLLALYVLYKLACHIYVYLRPSSLPSYLHPPDGAWALITGSSDGIGFGLAQELCHRGFNVILHGRNHTRLLHAQSLLADQFPTTKTRILVLDANTPASDPCFDRAIREAVDSITLTVLVNSFGGQQGILPAERFLLGFGEYTPAQIEGIVQINTLFMLHVTRCLFPVLRANAPSLLLNVSGLGARGMPYLSVYSGSKGYLEAFTRALRAEMRGEGKQVEVLAIQAGYVQTRSNPMATGYFVPSSRRFAAAVLNRVGCGRDVVFGYWPHWLQALGFVVLPEAWMAKIVFGETSRRKKEMDGAAGVGELEEKVHAL